MIAVSVSMCISADIAVEKPGAARFHAAQDLVRALGL